MNNKSKSQNEKILEGRLKQTSLEKKNIMEKGDVTFYNKSYPKLFFSVQPNQYKDQFDLMLECIQQLLSIENELFPKDKKTLSNFENLKDLTRKDKNKVSTGFSMILGNLSYLGWKIMKTVDFLSAVENDLKKASSF